MHSVGVAPIGRLHHFAQPAHHAGHAQPDYDRDQDGNVIECVARSAQPNGGVNLFAALPDSSLGRMQRFIHL